MTIGDSWYRYVDSDQEWSHDPYELQFRVIRYTSKCVVLDWYGTDKFVLLNARRRFAYPTKELAMESYIRRKEVEVSITAVRHDRAVEYLAAAKAMRDRGFVRERTPALPAPWLKSWDESDSGPCPSAVTS